MPQKIAVAIVHGIGNQTPDFAEGTMAELRSRFSKLVGGQTPDPAAEIVMEPVYWAPELQDQETELWSRLRKGGDLDFLSLRRFMVNFAADAIAYQPAPKERDAYDRIHARVAASMNKLAVAAGPAAPLCIIAHSLGTVIASNYIYDLGKHARKKLICRRVRNEMDDTPLERGETLASLYTFGSPIALWSLRYPDFGRPVDVPSPKLAGHHPAVAPVAEWINFYDEDDVIGYPLRTLNDAYKKAVKADIQVNAGGLLASWNPLSHNGYWTDNDVTKPIAAGLARLWQRANGF